ncbi:unnamed protein product [Phytophthora fragariaefolia]|uniref:Unnamed protein product n=1 Tax=Phytophthora fragariaefolia TaxID=1490495 RepID=A0A9W6XK35_9STRA|nr:unnamed protein product [Phytophthora fragariaefolia]
MGSTPEPRSRARLPSLTVRGARSLPALPSLHPINNATLTDCDLGVALGPSSELGHPNTTRRASGSSAEQRIGAFLSNKAILHKILPAEANTTHALRQSQFDRDVYTYIGLLATFEFIGML